MRLTSRALRAIRSSGLAFDSLWLLRRVAEEGPRRERLLRYLRLRFTPDTLQRVRALSLPVEERGRLFTAATSFLTVGGICKTTGMGRTRLVDEAIRRRAENFEAIRLLDVGVSDGSASLALLMALPNLREAVLVDRHPQLYARGPAIMRTFLDGEQRLLGIKLLGLYLSLPGRRRIDPSRFERVSTVNPIAAEQYGIREILPFDARRDVLTPPATIVKCANLLNLGYFPGLELRAGVANLGRSVADGGFLCISQNHPQYPDGEAYVVLRRKREILELDEERGGHAALDALAPLPIELTGGHDERGA